MPFAPGTPAAADGGALVGCGARQQLLCIAGPHDLHGLVAHRLRECRIERHEFAVQLPGVAIERGEQRWIGQIEIGLIECDLRGVDRLCEHDALLDDLLPGRSAERLVLPQRREVHRCRAADEAAVDVALEAAVECRESKLSAIRAFGAQVKAGGTQPSRHDVLAAVAGLEDAQRFRLELPALDLLGPRDNRIESAAGIRGRVRTC